MGYLKVIIDELVKSRKLGDSLAELSQAFYEVVIIYFVKREFFAILRGKLSYEEGLLFLFLTSKNKIFYS